MARIPLKMKVLPTAMSFSVQMQPYVDKALQGLSKTQLHADLVKPMEVAVRRKTQRDAEKLFCANRFDAYKNIYLTLVRHMIENLKIGNTINNLDLIDKINNGTISVDTVVEMNPEDMHGERWKILLEKKNYDVSQLTQDPEATSDLFWCGRCHRNKTTYFLRQDRCADEPMTVHITCCYCGHRWRN